MRLCYSISFKKIAAADLIVFAHPVRECKLSPCIQRHRWLDSGKLCCGVYTREGTTYYNFITNVIVCLSSSNTKLQYDT